MADLALVFRRPFRQQVAAFRLRLRHLVSTARWDDLRHHQSAHRRCSQDYSCGKCFHGPG